jgi:DNA helicase-2/ATP-dependent DNA helicase PcrA
MHGQWQTNIPSRFLDELPEEHVEVTESKGGFGWGSTPYGASRFDEATAFGSNYGTPGWQRAQSRRTAGSGEGFDEDFPAADLGRTRPGSSAGGSATPGRGGRFGGTTGAAGGRRVPLTIEGELVAKSTGAVSAFAVGDRIFHQKFGNGDVVAVDGNKLTIQFDRAGEKRVVDSFVQRA